jgi:hypothetical protein
MQDAPQRPEPVPEAAVYSPDFDSWEIAHQDADGKRSGECIFYRRDGSLYLRSTFRNGVQDGPFSMFHPNGQLAREGNYAQGELDGACIAYASDAATSLPLRSCCVPTGATKLRAEYRHGQVVRQDFYDAEERALSSDGSPLPARPESIPEHADFDDLAWRWVVREQKNPVCHLDRFFTAEGVLCEELEYSGGLKRARRLFDDAAALREACAFDDEGRMHGAFFKRFTPAETSPHADPRINQVHGQLEHEHPVGRYELLDRQQTLVRAVDFGRAWFERDLASSPALSAALEPGEASWATVEARAAEGSVREALCLAARTAVRDGNPARLEQFLKAHTFELTSELRAQRAEALLADSNATLLGALDELLLGAEPAGVYRTLAAVLTGAARVAEELVNASLLLAPERSLTHLTRGLVRLELGDVAGVREDAERLAPASASGAEFLRDSLRVYFPEFGFWPAEQALGPPPEGAADVELAQPLAAVERLIRVYATRLGRVRAGLQALYGAEASRKRLPPDLSHLLPDGPVELRKWTVNIEDETEDGGVESCAIEVDERLELQTESATALMSAARASYAALSWLCWAVGLDQIGLPERIEQRPDFAAAVSMALLRHFRASDRLKTGGLVSLAQGVPSFCWEGLEIDSLNPRFAQILAEEYLEVRAMFLWSMWQENASPFQADLRSD